MVLKAFKEKIDLLPIDFKQRTFHVLYQSFYNILIETIQKLDENLLVSIPSLFKKFAEELKSIIIGLEPNNIDGSLKRITLEFLYRAAIYKEAAEEAILYLENLISLDSQDNLATNLRLLGKANLIIAKNIIDSRASNEYEKFIEKAKKYFNEALTLSQQFLNRENISLIQKSLKECDQVILNQQNSVNTTPIAKILIRKIGVIIAKQNMQIVNGNTPNQLDKIKINSFELTRITHEEDLSDVKHLISSELQRTFNDGFTDISISQNKIVVIFKYHDAISIYSEKYYPPLIENDSSSLAYVEKLTITDEQISFIHKVSKFSSKENLIPIITYYNSQSYYSVASTITLLPEFSHSVQHYMNVERLIDILNNNEICSNDIICLERKQHGNNLGIADVIALANYLDQENILLTGLQQLPIYHDAFLYNVAKAKGVQVIGIEGKGLAYSKESPYYHQAREEYMAEQLLAIARIGKNAIFLVGAAHINSLIKLLGAQGFRVDDSDSSLERNLITLKPEQAIFTRKLISSEVSTDLIRIDKVEYRVETNSQSNTENLGHEAVQSYSFISYIYEFAEQLDLNWQVQKLFHLADLAKFELLKEKYGITAPFDAFRVSNSNFRKSVLLKLHPDKGGNNDDFIFVQNLREELNKPFDVQKLLNEKIQDVQPFIYKANIGFKVFDAAVDASRLIYIPTTDNAKKVLIDTTYLYSMHSGVNGFSTIINGIDITYKIYQGEYEKALTQALTTISYMLIPVAISFVAIPYVGFMYGTGVAVYIGYSAIANGYSLYNEFHQKDFKLNSNIAYQNLVETLSTTYLQNLYDFTTKAKEYEKTIYKIQLETKGEFGQKLYEYIYSRLIEEKYDLQNKVTQGILNEEEANQLKAKHIQIMNYDHCMEVIGLKEEQSDHYYCYNEEQQVFDYVIIIGNSYVEKISSL